MMTNSLKENFKKCESECRSIAKAYEYFTGLSKPYVWYDEEKGEELYLIYDIKVKRNVASYWWQIDDIEFRGPSYDHIVLKLMNYENGKEHKTATDFICLTDKKDDSVTLDKILKDLKVRIPTDEELAGADFNGDIPVKKTVINAEEIRKSILEEQRRINDRQSKITDLKSKAIVYKELLKEFERKIKAAEVEIKFREEKNEESEKKIKELQAKLEKQGA